MLHKLYITPSVEKNCDDRCEDVSMLVDVSGSFGQNELCKILNGICCNGCEIKDIAVKKWTFISKTNAYGWKMSLGIICSDLY